MTPQEFRLKWDITLAEMAEICRCDLRTVKRWFSKGVTYTAPNPQHEALLGMADAYLVGRLSERPELAEIYERIRERREKKQRKASKAV